MAQSKFVGVDGCKGGWFSVGFDHGGAYELGVHDDFSQLLAYYGDAELILVDMPIGLSDGPEERDGDKPARSKLPSRRSSVFRIPTRQTMEYLERNPDDHDEAKDIEHRATGGTSISPYTFGIVCKIIEVDKVMRARPRDAKPSVREVHPEICFWALNAKQEMEYSKDPRKGPEGVEERRRVLEKIEPSANSIYSEALRKYMGKQVAEDDIVDALAAAVTAYHGQGKLRTLPENPTQDQRGLPMEMVYYIP